MASLVDSFDQAGPFDRAVAAFQVDPFAQVEEAFQVAPVEEAFQVAPFFEVVEASQVVEDGLASAQVVVDVAALAVAQVAPVAVDLAFAVDQAIYQVAQAFVLVAAVDPAVAVDLAFDLVVAAAQVEAVKLLTSWLAAGEAQVASASDQAVAVQAGLEALTEEACLVAAAIVDPSVEAFLAGQVACQVDHHPSEVAEAFLVEVADHLAVAFLAGPCQAGVIDQVGTVEASAQALGNQAAD